MARPRKYSDSEPAPSVAQRVRASRERRVAAGQREVRVWLSAEQAKALDDYARTETLSPAEAVARLIDSHLIKG